VNKSGWLGSRNYRPDGFLTLDIDTTHAPDIAADACDLRGIAADSVSEICASHILEHLPWPLAYQALAEWGRVVCPGGRLRVAVPDMAMLAGMVADGRNVWTAMGLIYGLGRIGHALEAHQYGDTEPILRDVLRSLGFGEFTWWKHDVKDASNGWMPDEKPGRIAMSLNLAATQLRDPAIVPKDLLADLMADPMAPFDMVYARHVAHPTAPDRAADDNPRLTQRLHIDLIDDRMRILYLEDELQALRTQIDQHTS
jgi:hypothetical protein